MYKQYQVIESIKDIDPIIKKGMKGVILEVWDSENFEVEFLDEEGFNYGYNGKFTFKLTSSDIKECSAT